MYKFVNEGHRDFGRCELFRDKIDEKDRGRVDHGDHHEQEIKQIPPRRCPFPRPECPDADDELDQKDLAG